MDRRQLPPQLLHRGLSNKKLVFSQTTCFGLAVALGYECIILQRNRSLAHRSIYYKCVALENEYTF